jgi:hypothetical protein
MRQADCHLLFSIAQMFSHLCIQDTQKEPKKGSRKQPVFGKVFQLNFCTTGVEGH